MIEEIVNESVEQQYLVEKTKGDISISVIPLKEEAVNIEASVKEAVQASLKKKEITADVKVSTEHAQTLEKAKQVNLSVNKYLLFEEFNQKGINLDIEEYGKQSISVIKNMGDKLLQEQDLSEENSGETAGKSPGSHEKQTKSTDTKK